MHPWETYMKHTSSEHGSTEHIYRTYWWNTHLQGTHPWDTYPQNMHPQGPREQLDQCLGHEWSRMAQAFYVRQKLGIDTLRFEKWEML